MWDNTSKERKGLDDVMNLMPTQKKNEADQPLIHCYRQKNPCKY